MSKIGIGLDPRAGAAQGLATSPWTRIRSRTLGAVLGDSLAAGLHLDAGTYRNVSARHPLNWANGLSGGRLQFVSANRGNFGVSGERSDQIMARIPAVIASGAGVVWLIDGTNDIAQQYPTGPTCAQTAAANIIATCRALLTAGCAVILELVPGAQNYTAAQIGYLNSLNQRLIEYAATAQEVYLHDSSRMILNPTNGTGALAWNTGYTQDGTHPAVAGAYYWGKSLAALLQRIVPPTQRLGHINLGDAQPTQFLLNPFFATTTGGTNGNSGAAVTSGTVAQSWTVSRTGSATATLAYAADDGAALDPSVGNKCTATCTFTAAGEIIRLWQNLAAGTWFAGYIFDFGCRSRVVSGMDKLSAARLGASVSIDSVVRNYYSMVDAATSDTQPDESYTIDHVLGPITIHGATTPNYLTLQVEMVAKAAGVAVIDLSRFQVRKRLVA